MLRDNVDTDMIIRIERIASLKRGEFGRWAFEMLRYRPDGSEDPDFVLNRAAYRAARILVSGTNFGCGSSREMAVWALAEFGIRCIIAGSYGDIFRSNCLQNGLLPITLGPEPLSEVAAAAVRGTTVRVDLVSCTVSAAGLRPVTFALPEGDRGMLLTGLDEVGQSLKLAAAIDAYQEADRSRRPWVYCGRGR